MTTAHHPSHTGARWHPKHEWLWMGLSAILVAALTIAVLWFASSSNESVAPTPDAVAGFEYDQEATVGRIASPGITAQYFGNSGELNPAISVLPAATGFGYDHEVTPVHIARPGITAQYFGNSGELYPAVSVLPMATGFGYDHEVTPINIASPGITTQYFGNSGELNPEN